MQVAARESGLSLIKFLSLATGLLVLGFGSMVRAQDTSALRLPAIISDNMVLQSAMNPVIWGWASANETVTVTIAGQTKTATADAAGKWSLKLDPITAKGPYEMTLKGKSALLTVKNILVGEVWLCSGQSNMELKVGNIYQHEAVFETKAAINYPEIRYFALTEAKAKTPADDCKGSWVVCSPGTLRETFSAVAYFFGKDLYLQLRVPIGLIGSFRGATYAEQWTSQEALEAKPDLQPIVDRLKAGQSAGAVDGNSVPNEQAACFYNGMIAPIIPYTMRGAIWYQGEGNTPRAYQYRTLLPTLIGDWRKRWGEGDFPFLIVQLANYNETNPNADWPELREAQFQTLSTVPATGLAVTIDIGEALNVHPHDKADVGLRLALWALANTYGQTDLVYAGPLYDGFTVEGSSIRLKFKEVGNGLFSKDLRPLKYFSIAGKDQKWFDADVVMDGKVSVGGATLLVSSKNVPEPVAVRYAWLPNPENVNFINADGLPASPFRTDDWPGPVDSRK